MYGLVLGDWFRLHEKFEGQFGEHTDGGGDVLCHIDETTQWDPAIPSIRASPDLGRVAAPGLAVEALLNIKVKLEAEIFTYFNLLEGGRTSILVTPWTTEISCNPSRRPPPADLWTAKWYLRLMTPKFWSVKAAVVGHPLASRWPIKSSEINEKQTNNFPSIKEVL